MFRMNRKIISGAVAFSLLVLCIFLVNLYLSLKKEGVSLKTRQQEILMLSSEYQIIKKSIDAAEKKKAVVKVDGIVQAIDGILRSAGLSRNIKSVKSIGIKDRKYANEEEAEIQLEKLNMNELVNILYKLENAPMIISIKKSVIKTTFESPSLLNVSLVIGLINPK